MNLKQTPKEKLRLFLKKYLSMSIAVGESSEIFEEALRELIKLFNEKRTNVDWKCYPALGKHDETCYHYQNRGKKDHE